MTPVRGAAVRIAGASDAPAIGALLHAFNLEFGQPTPGKVALGRRVVELLGIGDTVVLLVGDGPDGLAVLRFRRAIWSEGLECYLAELFVTPDLRGHGLGRSLLEAAIEVARERGADTMDLGTDETDAVARHLYERCGFSNREGGEDGPRMYVYERAL
jgi:GNAT superfamily N-acetyltransferase